MIAQYHALVTIIYANKTLYFNKNQNKAMNIYEFRVSEEKEWICANTIFGALKFYRGLTDYELDDFDPDNDDIVMIPPEKWNEYTITDPDNGNAVIETFEQYMQGKVDVDIIATTAL